MDEKKELRARCFLCVILHNCARKISSVVFLAALVCGFSCPIPGRRRWCPTWQRLEGSAQSREVWRVAVLPARGWKSVVHRATRVEKSGGLPSYLQEAERAWFPGLPESIWRVAVLPARGWKGVVPRATRAEKSGGLPSYLQEAERAWFPVLPESRSLEGCRPTCKRLKGCGFPGYQSREVWRVAVLPARGWKDRVPRLPESRSLDGFRPTCHCELKRWGPKEWDKPTMGRQSTISVI